MKNQVIEVIDREHGMKVIEYWKSKGVDTSGMLGFGTKKAGYLCRYCGVIDGCFDCYSEREAAENNAEIIELPEEKTYPKVMIVSEDGEKWHKRVVLMYKNGRYLAWNCAETFEEAEKKMNLTSWRFAKDIEEPKEITITLSDINSKIEDIKKLFGAEENDKIVIKVD